MGSEAKLKADRVKGKVTKPCDHGQEILTFLSLSFFNCQIGITVTFIIVEAYQTQRPTHASALYSTGGWEIRRTSDFL